MGSFSVVSNIAAANATANLQGTQVGLNKALGRLSSGYRINYSGDDAAGLAVANDYRNKVTILNQGIRNANDGMSKLQIKDGALSNISTLLDRLATLATQAGSSSNGVDISKLSDEYGKIIEEIDREATVAGLDSDEDFSVFVSSESVASDGAVSDTIGAAGSSDLGLSASSFTDAEEAQDALAEVQSAISSLGDVQNTVGTLQNRLSFAMTLAQSQMVNNKAAESRIRDANIAEESASMAKFNILTQAGMAALSQANQSNQSILSLLR
jgi:flagellin